MSRDDDSLLSRWSRRKRASAREVGAPGVQDPEPPRPDENASDEELTETELLQKLGLPDPDTLTSGDDFRAFMAKSVPDYLRRRALRRLWVSNPVLANVDGLVDHGEDFTDAATVPDALRTGYRVGKGFLRDIVDVAPDEDADESETAVSEEVDVEDDDEVEAVAESPGAERETAAEAGDGDDPDAPRPRRMTFRAG